MTVQSKRSVKGETSKWIAAQTVQNPIWYKMSEPWADGTRVLAMLYVLFCVVLGHVLFRCRSCISTFTSHILISTSTKQRNSRFTHLVKAKLEEVTALEADG
jgi:hypothetical protein